MFPQACVKNSVRGGLGTQHALGQTPPLPSECWDTHTHTPWAVHAGIHTHPPWVDTPWADTPPRADTPPLPRRPLQRTVRMHSCVQ